MENNFRITMPSHGRLIRTNIKSKVKVGMPLILILCKRKCTFIYDLSDDITSVKEWIISKSVN